MITFTEFGSIDEKAIWIRNFSTAYPKSGTQGQELLVESKTSDLSPISKLGLKTQNPKLRTQDPNSGTLYVCGTETQDSEIRTQGLYCRKDDYFHSIIITILKFKNGVTGRTNKTSLKLNLNHFNENWTNFFFDFFHRMFTKNTYIISIFLYYLKRKIQEICGFYVISSYFIFGGAAMPINNILILLSK